MPVDRPGVVHLWLLLLIVPAQYLITIYFGASDAEKSGAYKELISGLYSFTDRYLSWQSWRRWMTDVMVKMAAGMTSAVGLHRQQEKNEESLAVEVLNYRDKNGYFADSLEPRTPRSSSVKYRIGQVIKHKVYGYRGIIVGWDTVPKAPKHWLRANHPADKKHWQNMPCYLILVDIRDRPKAQKTYVVEENIELLHGMILIIHPELEEYFDGVEASRYLPKARLKSLYPDD